MFKIVLSRESYDTYIGAVELNRRSQRHLLIALFLAGTFHFAAVSSYWISAYFEEEEPPARVIRISNYQELGPPPSITGTSQAVAPSVSVASSAAKPAFGIPVPVPDVEVSPEQTFATQEELSEEVNPLLTEEGAGEGGVITDEPIEIEEPPPDFVYYEQAPFPVKCDPPVYPELARRAGIQGIVWYKAWVTKEGTVKQVVITKSPSELLNQAVIDAAMKCTYHPALSHGVPVAVWVSTSFKFELK